MKQTKFATGQLRQMTQRSSYAKFNGILVAWATIDCNEQFLVVDADELAFKTKMSKEVLDYYGVSSLQSYHFVLILTALGMGWVPCDRHDKSDIIA